MIHSLIRKLQTLGPLPDDDVALLEQLAGDAQEFAARRDIIGVGDKPDHVHLLLKGWACRYQVLPDGGRQITAFLVPGDFCDVHTTIFGAMDHSIAALGPATVAFIARPRMLELTERPSIARALWWASLVDEAVLRAWIVNLGRRDAFERISHLVCEMHARLDNVGMIAGEEFSLPLTQEELGDALGLTPIHVSRVLKRLREEGLMGFKRRQITILDIGRLREIAGFDPNYLHLTGNMLAGSN
jgi:CRP-like cAMP-binding protein